MHLHFRPVAARELIGGPVTVERQLARASPCRPATRVPGAGRFAKAVSRPPAGRLSGVRGDIAASDAHVPLASPHKRPWRLPRRFGSAVGPSRLLGTGGVPAAVGDTDTKVRPVQLVCLGRKFIRVDPRDSRRVWALVAGRRSRGLRTPATLCVPRSGGGVVPDPPLRAVCQYSRFGPQVRQTRRSAKRSA